MLSLTSPMFCMLSDFDFPPAALCEPGTQHRRPRAPVHARPNYRVLSADAASTIAVELPGVSKHDVDVQVHGRVLSISGKRFRLADRPGRNDTTAATDSAPAPDATQAAPTSPVNPNAQQTAHREQDDRQKQEHQQQGTEHTLANSPLTPTPDVVFDLSLKLAPDADADAVSVQSYADGVLVLSVPHRQPGSPRKLSVQ